MRVKFISPVDSYVTALLCVRFSVGPPRRRQRVRKGEGRGGIPRDGVCMKILWVIEYFRKFKRYRLHPARETILSDGGFRSTACSRYDRYSYGQKELRDVASSVEESNEQ